MTCLICGQVLCFPITWHSADSYLPITFHFKGTAAPRIFARFHLLQSTLFLHLKHRQYLIRFSKGLEPYVYFDHSLYLHHTPVRPASNRSPTPRFPNLSSLVLHPTGFEPSFNRPSWPNINSSTLTHPTSPPSDFLEVLFPSRFHASPVRPSPYPASPTPSSPPPHPPPPPPLHHRHAHLIPPPASPSLCNPPPGDPHARPTTARIQRPTHPNLQPPRRALAARVGASAGALCGVVGMGGVGFLEEGGVGVGRGGGG